VRGGVCSVCGVLNSWDERQADRLSANERGYDRRWRKLRQAVLNGEPLCRACQAMGRVRSAEHLDHIVPQALRGDNDLDNLQPLCRPCHELKSAAERQMFRKWKGGLMTKVVLVAGPSGSGKTTFVHAHKQATDIIIDVDALVHALTGQPWYERPPEAWKIALDLRDLLLLRLLKPSDVRVAWVIASEPDAHARRELAERIRAGRVIVLEVDRNECVRRITADSRRSAHVQYWSGIVDRWWSAYGRNEHEEIIAHGI